MLMEISYHRHPILSDNELGYPFGGNQEYFIRYIFC